MTTVSITKARIKVVVAGLEVTAASASGAPEPSAGFSTLGVRAGEERGFASVAVAVAMAAAAAAVGGGGRPETASPGAAAAWSSANGAAKGFVGCAARSSARGTVNGVVVGVGRDPMGSGAGGRAGGGAGGLRCWCWYRCWVANYSKQENLSVF